MRLFKQKAGHQDDATLTDRKGGSTNGVPRILLKHEWNIGLGDTEKKMSNILSVLCYY